MLLSPADYVIGKLGGLAKTASKIKTVKKPDGLSVSTVQGWRVRGRIPQDHWPLCIEAAQAEGIKLSLADFLNDHAVEAEESAA
ncbi:carph-isopro domain-containing protein [Mesorhizobium sp. URHB0026]